MVSSYAIGMWTYISYVCLLTEQWCKIHSYFEIMRVRTHHQLVVNHTGNSSHLGLTKAFRLGARHANYYTSSISSVRLNLLKYVCLKIPQAQRLLQD
jgi:hypothetical protein